MARVTTISSLFQQYDTPRDGTISGDKMRAILVAACGVSATEAEDMWTAHDANSGPKGKYKGFLSWLFDGGAEPKGREFGEDRLPDVAPTDESIHRKAAALGAQTRALFQDAQEVVGNITKSKDQEDIVLINAELAPLKQTEAVGNITRSKDQDEIERLKATLAGGKEKEAAGKSEDQEALDLLKAELAAVKQTNAVGNIATSKDQEEIGRRKTKLAGLRKTEAVWNSEDQEAMAVLKAELAASKKRKDYALSDMMEELKAPCIVSRPCSESELMRGRRVAITTLGKPFGIPQRNRSCRTKARRS